MLSVLTEQKSDSIKIAASAQNEQSPNNYRFTAYVYMATHVIPDNLDAAPRP